MHETSKVTYNNSSKVKFISSLCTSQKEFDNDVFVRQRKENSEPKNL